MTSGLLLQIEDVLVWTKWSIRFCWFNITFVDMKRNHPTKKNEEPAMATVPLSLIEDLANRKPTHDPEKNLYRLTHFVYNQISCCDGSDAYPKYQITEYAVNLYKTRDDAEEYIKNVVSNRELQQEVNHFTVEQLSLGGSTSAIGGTWLYDNYGTLIDYSVSGRFYGRTPERTRFNRGDIVEVITNNLREKKVTLAIVVYAPPSIEHCHELFNDVLASGDGYPLTTHEDDCYMVADSLHASPFNVASIQIMVPRFEIAENLRCYLQDCLKTANINTFVALHPQPPYNMFGQMAVCICHDSAKDQPYVEIFDKNNQQLTRLCIDKPQYLSEEDIRLSNREKESLMQLLTTVDCGRTMWWYIIRRFIEWNNDYRIELPCSTPMPDYMLLPE